MPLIRIAIVMVIVSTPVLLPARQPSLNSITFAGNDSLSASLLKEQMTLRAKGIWDRIFVWKKPHLFSPEILARDIERMTRLYQSEGFLHCSIKPAVYLDESGKEADVKIEVTEGSPVMVQSIVIEMAAPDSATKKAAQSVLATLTKQFQLAAGKRFRDLALSNDEKRIVDRLVAAGFPYTRLLTDLLVNEEKTAVYIRFNISARPEAPPGSPLCCPARLRDSYPRRFKKHSTSMLWSSGAAAIGGRLRSLSASI